MGLHFGVLQGLCLVLGLLFLGLHFGVLQGLGPF